MEVYGLLYSGRKISGFSKISFVIYGLVNPARVRTDDTDEGDSPFGQFKIHEKMSLESLMVFIVFGSFKDYFRWIRRKCRILV